jgi:hypothetical protein
MEGVTRLSDSNSTFTLLLAALRFYLISEVYQGLIETGAGQLEGK